MDAAEMKYTQVDDLAWEFFELDYDFNAMTKNKGFFVYYKTHYPYSKYYEKAELELRRMKINKIING